MEKLSFLLPSSKDTIHPENLFNMVLKRYIAIESDEQFDTINFIPYPLSSLYTSRWWNLIVAQNLYLLYFYFIFYPSFFLKYL